MKKPRICKRCGKDEKHTKFNKWGRMCTPCMAIVYRYGTEHEQPRTHTLATERVALDFARLTFELFHKPLNELRA